MAQWLVYESRFSGTYYHVRGDTAAAPKALWAFTDIDAARIAARSLNQKRLARRSALGQPFSYYDDAAGHVVSNGL